MGLSEIDRSFARLGEQSCRPSTPAGKLLVPETTYPAALFQLGFSMPSLASGGVPFLSLCTPFLLSRTALGRPEACQ